MIAEMGVAGTAERQAEWLSEAIATPAVSRFFAWWSISTLLTCPACGDQALLQIGA